MHSARDDEELVPSRRPLRHTHLQYDGPYHAAVSGRDHGGVDFYRGHVVDKDTRQQQSTFVNVFFFLGD